MAARTRWEIIECRLKPPHVWLTRRSVRTALGGGTSFPTQPHRRPRPAPHRREPVPTRTPTLASPEPASAGVRFQAAEDRSPLLPSSWDRWAELFEEAGYAALSPHWPDDPETVEEARANPDVFAKKTLGQVADHTAEVIAALERKPAVMGHSTGGLLAQTIADRGLSAATVAIDPGPFRGVLPLPISALRSAMPVLKNPLNRGTAVTLTLDEFKYGWANAVGDEEARQLYETFHVAAPGVALMQMANANLNPFAEARLDPKKPEARPAADHRRREGPHRPVGDRQRVLQAPAEKTRASPRSCRSPTAATR